MCPACIVQIERLEEPLCDRCGRPIEVCSCSVLSPALDFVYSAAWYEGWLRQAIRAFKYEGEFDRAGHLSDLISPLVDRCDGDATMVPVPLHPERERSRGFNQAHRLADEVAMKTGRPVEMVLRRTIATQQQIHLSATERARNVQNAFATVEPSRVSGRSFVLIDDVMTTGSTLGECAAALKTAGAARVGAITLARER